MNYTKQRYSLKDIPFDITSVVNLDYRILHREALEIIGEFWSVYEGLANDIGVYQKSDLPFPKRNIIFSIFSWYKLLNNERLRNFKEKVISEYSSDDAGYLLSDNFRSFLLSALDTLARFISEEEVIICSLGKSSEAEKIYSKVNKKSVLYQNNCKKGAEMNMPQKQ